MTDSATSERACQSARADGTPSAPGLMAASLELFFQGMYFFGFSQLSRGTDLLCEHLPDTSQSGLV